MLGLLYEALSPERELRGASERSPRYHDDRQKERRSDWSGASGAWQLMLHNERWESIDQRFVDVTANCHWSAEQASNQG